MHIFNANMPKYPFSDVCLRGSSAVKIISNSKMSEFDSRGGVRIFQIILKFKKNLNYTVGGGWGSKPNWEFFPIFFVF